jgi:hypothetical protein
MLDICRPAVLVALIGDHTPKTRNVTEAYHFSGDALIGDVIDLHTAQFTA